VQVAEPGRRRHEIGIARERTLEARLRNVVFSEHERGNTRAETEARIAGLERCSFRQRLECVAKAAFFNRGEACAREQSWIVRCP